ncbi:MAG: aldehyde dehydrogenase [Candidatus Rokuibacteriota bacterium]|nr:MAG: aldehyde dehydrogenase [Candidatus Rokubacteria bacterium]PYN68859.1 MAG: aldehyde dehydrogenase [Candidatus Rokubacteria bacterium]
MTAPSPFRKELEAAVNARHSRLNPFTEKWVKGELSRAQLGAWAAQHYQYVSQFPRWCATVYGECPDPDARDFLLENIIEEESGTKHVDLLIRFAEACGVSRAEVETARQLPTTRGLTAWCYEMSHRPFHIAAAGLLVGLESQVPGIYKRNLPPLKTHYGFTDHEVEFFAIHIEADEVHGERGYAIVEHHSTTPEKKVEAIEAVRQATEMRWQYMTGLHRAFVLKEEL